VSAEAGWGCCVFARLQVRVAFKPAVVGDNLMSTLQELQSVSHSHHGLVYHKLLAARSYSLPFMVPSRSALLAAVHVMVCCALCNLIIVPNVKVLLAACMPWQLQLRMRAVRCASIPSSVFGSSDCMHAWTNSLTCMEGL
jgi:hypothetical protein